MMPLACMPFAISSISLVRRVLVFFLAVISHLNQKSILDRSLDFLRIRREPQRGGFPQCRQLTVVDVIQLALGKAEKENRPQLRPECDQHPVTTYLPLPRPCYSPLHQPSPHTTPPPPPSA